MIRDLPLTKCSTIYTLIISWRLFNYFVSLNEASTGLHACGLHLQFELVCIYVHSEFQKHYTTVTYKLQFSSALFISVIKKINIIKKLYNFILLMLADTTTTTIESVRLTFISFMLKIIIITLVLKHMFINVFHMSACHAYNMMMKD